MPTRPPTHSQLLKQTVPPIPRRTVGDYGRRWKRLARMVKARQPLCADPFGTHAKDGVIVPGEQVDHIIPRSAGGQDTFENLQNLCASCHSRKTVMHDGGFGRARAQRTPTENQVNALAMKECIDASTTRATSMQPCINASPSMHDR